MPFPVRTTQVLDPDKPTPIDSLRHGRARGGVFSFSSIFPVDTRQVFSWRLNAGLGGRNMDVPCFSFFTSGIDRAACSPPIVKYNGKSLATELAP